MIPGNYTRRHVLICLITGDNFDCLVDSAKCFHCRAEYFTLINKYLVTLRLLNILSPLDMSPTRFSIRWSFTPVLSLLCPAVVQGDFLIPSFLLHLLVGFLLKRRAFPSLSFLLISKWINAFPFYSVIMHCYYYFNTQTVPFLAIVSFRYVPIILWVLFF